MSSTLKKGTESIIHPNIVALTKVTNVLSLDSLTAFTYFLLGNLLVKV